MFVGKHGWFIQTVLDQQEFSAEFVMVYFHIVSLFWKEKYI